MRNKKQKVILIKEKDIALFNYLHFFKVATIEQIKRDVLPNLKRSTFYLRLKTLEDFKYITRGRTLTRCGQWLSITRKCFDEFIATGDEVRVELMSNSLEHDLALVDICRYLKKSPRVLQYLSENELQTWQKYDKKDETSDIVSLQSDACILLKLDNGEYWIPIEYEASVKSEARYKEIIQKFYFSIMFTGNILCMQK